ncbi:MAG: glycosyltransferase family 2 protein [Mycoplasmoidaceae bacterium]
MKKIKISVLIPCYNCQKFIYKCIKSVLDQTVKVDEILVVNDGSSDQSLSIIKELQAQHNNIKVIDQKNMGLAKTRNILIDNSTGDYFYFLDSDDWIESNCIESFLKKLDQSPYEMIFARCYLGSVVNKFNSNIYPDTTKESYCLYNCTYIWNILFSREFWNKFHLRFYDDYPAFEDIGVFGYILSKATNVGFMTEITYHYIHNPKSLSRSNYNEAKVYNLYKQVENLYILLNKEYGKNFPRYINDIIALDLSVLINAILFLTWRINKIKYLKMVRRLEKKHGRIKYPICIWKFWFFFLYRIFIW